MATRMSAAHAMLPGMDDLSTLVSTLTAVVATVVSLFLLRQGQADRRELRRDQERAQARQVSSWADWHSDECMTFAKPRLPAVFVANSSDSAVYDVFFDFRTPDTGALRRASLGPVAPGEQKFREIDYDGPLSLGWEPAALHARVYFRDSAGVRWLRDSQGRLRADHGAEADEFYELGGQLIRD